MTIELSRDKPHLTRPRMSDAEAVDTDAERSRNQDERGRFVTGNDAGRNHSAKRVLTRHLREAAQDAAGDSLPPSDAREVAQDARTLYVAAKRSVGHSSTVVLASLVHNSVNTVVAARLMAEAVRVGITTEEGARLIELAHKCEARAERSMVAALAFATALKSAKPPRNLLQESILAAGEEAGGDR